jgi:diguanylate cyclase (GGDEF)-like protein/PAS domain S-box-containing protein
MARLDAGSPLLSGVVRVSIQNEDRGRSATTADTARPVVLDPGARELFDRLARLAGLALRAPVAMVGFPEGEHLTLVGSVGVPQPWLDAGHLPLDATFCKYVLQTGDAFVVEDAARHALAFSVPRLDNFRRVAYCGVPIHVHGRVLAVLSVGDREPRRWAQAEITVLRDLALSAERDLEAGRSRAAAMSSTEGAMPVEPAIASDVVPDALVTVDADWQITFVNNRAQELLGEASGVRVGRVFWDVYPGLVGTRVHRESQRVLTERVSVEVEDYCESLDRWLEVRAYPSAEGGAALLLRDVSARRSAQDELRGRESRYRRLFEESRTPLFVMTADTRITEVNRACEDLLGLEREALSRTTLRELAADAAAFERVIGHLVEDGAVSEEEVTLRRGADTIVCLLSAGQQESDGGVVYHGGLRDVTEERRTQEELVRTAMHDPLTGLPNRVVLMDRLDQLLKHAKRHPDHRFAVLFIDLDDFKTVNDTHGHQIGDHMLVSVARRLEGCVRDEDTVGRLSGDEFAILLDAVQDPASVTFVVDRIRESLSEPFTAGGRQVPMTVSIGIAMNGNRYDTAADLLRDADAAMYRAKAAGRNGYVIFDSDMHERALAQRQLEEDLRAAVARQELAVHYHPVVELDRGSVTGLEALIRWTHPERGILLPAEFMPLAEQTGLIVEIGWWVLGEACRQLRSWQLEYPDAAFRLTMSVNLSAKQFVHPELVDRIDAILAETGLDPRCLRLDLTEAVVMRNAQLAARLLQDLRDRGIHICIDDFGTGYSSLRQLREFPISTLKIDRSFIGQLDAEGGGRDVVQTIIALGRSMAIEAVAEGVETPEQLEQLRQLGTRFAQGFLFSLPLDSNATTSLLAESR